MAAGGGRQHRGGAASEPARRDPGLRRVAAAGLGLLLTFAAQGCSAEELPPENLRHGRFGALRDLVLFPRPGAPFFLDRFETTAADWRQFRGEDGPALRSEEGALPKTGIELWQAREFARWRFCRLPRHDEWFTATTSGGLYQFPWGDKARLSWANTVELGLGEPTPAGTFESGRLREGPYDLVGNCAEWTETVPLSWFGGDRDVVVGFSIALERVRASPALACWGGPHRPVPALWLVQSVTGHVPRLAVGGDFLQPMEIRYEVPGSRPIPITLVPEARLPGDRRSTIGVRLAADPGGLLLELLSYRKELEPFERELVLRFVARAGHRKVLREAFPGALAELAERGLEPGPVAELLAWELDA